MRTGQRDSHPLLVWAWSLLRLEFVGVGFGALFFCLSLTPPQHRPKLVLYGESLGAMAGQAAFDRPPDIATAGFDAVLWAGPRVLFLQHASDPVVWWSTDLLFSRPDWLTEPPGPDRTASMRWYPAVTFWQVSADLTNAETAPAGHDHNYGDAILDGWVAVLPPAGWTAGDTERVRAVLHPEGNGS